MLEQIKASAGSGKTYTLTQRFLTLLHAMSTDGSTWPCRSATSSGGHSSLFSEILAMTFTNKAAAEMKARVIESLKTLALQNERNDLDIFSPQEARTWLTVILKRYDSLNIRTIDSLLTLLLRISAISLNIPPDFELSFDDSGYFEPLYDELLDRATAGEKEISFIFNSCAEYLVYHTKFEGISPKNRIRDLMLETLDKVQKSQHLPTTDKDEVYSRLQKSVNQISRTSEDFANHLERLNLQPLANFTKFLVRCCEYKLGDACLKSVYASKPSFADCVRKADQHLINSELEDAYSLFCLKLAQANEHIAIYKSAWELMPFANAACLLLPQVEEMHRTSGQIPSSLLPLLARDVLNAEAGVSEACCRMGSRLTHILIDEFQDTSRSQWEAIFPLVIECLSRGGSLRYVGDVKQAIYSWRGGDSSLFDEISTEPGLLAIESHPQKTELCYNWRSLPMVVEYNNAIFGQLAKPAVALSIMRCLLPAAYPESQLEQAASLLSTAFTGAEQKTPEMRQNHQDAAEGFVQVLKLEAETSTELEEQIKNELYLIVMQDLLLRREPGEIAVLVRKKSEAELVATWLLEWGVSIVTEHSFKLAGNPLIQRIISFLKFLDYPPDDLNFWNFISSSELFITSSGLSQLYLHNWLVNIQLEKNSSNEKRNHHLFSFFRRDFPETWLYLIEPFYNQSGFMSAYDTVSEVIKHYRLFEQQPGQVVYLRRFLELLHTAESLGHSSPAAFLEFWSNHGEEESVPSPETPNAIQIMTIHKAKGLEFPVVIMPFHRFSDAITPELCLIEFEGLPLLLRDMPELGKEYYHRKNIAAVEKLYLLYVGWTRAGEELHLLIGKTKNDDAKAGMPRVLDTLLQVFTESSKSNSWSCGKRKTAKISRPYSELTFIPAEPAYETNREDEIHPYINPEQAEALQMTEDWLPMRWLPRLKIFRNPVPELVYNERLRGILFHNALENLYIQPDLKFQSIPELIERAVNLAFRQFHLPLDLADEAKNEIKTALNWFCEQKQALYWLANGKAEQSILDENGNLHRIDLLVDEKEKGYLVVEYKSGKPQEEHSTQIQRYLTLLATKGRPVRGVLVYLDEQRLQEITL